MVKVESEVDRILRHYGFDPENADDCYTAVYEHRGAFERLYEWYANSGEMPYGVMKARTGDPYEWIYERLERNAR